MGDPISVATKPVVATPSPPSSKPKPKVHALPTAGAVKEKTPTDRSKEAHKSNGQIQGVLSGGTKKVGTTASAGKKVLSLEDFKKAIKEAAQGPSSKGSKEPSFADVPKPKSSGAKVDSSPALETSTAGTTRGKDESKSVTLDTTPTDRSPKFKERSPNASYPRTLPPTAPEARGR